ncbi:MAG: S1C family serine protease [Butyricicoccaceae bacterium]
MDEWNNNGTNGGPEEPRTPYQTPVRGEGQNQQSYPNYDDWKQQKKNNKKHGRRPLMIAGGIVLAIAVFAGGVAVGGGFDGLFDRIQGTDTVEGTDSSLPADSQKLVIAEEKQAADALSGNEIYAKASPSVVAIQVASVQNQTEASGSGVIMSEDGYIITNEHVVEDGNVFTVVLDSGKSYEAELIGSDKKTDLAVLKVDTEDKLTAAEFGDSENLSVGERCYTIGSPGGLELQNTFTGGYISAINRDVTINDRVMSLIQTDAAINSGNSGGALLNVYGQVIGITSAKISSTGSSTTYEGLGFAIPMSTAKEIVDELIAYGYVTGRPAIGISGMTVTEQMSQYYNIPQGMLVTSVDTRSDAYEQGVQANDVIIAIDGEEVSNMTEINTIKEKHKAGDEITLTIYRSGKEKKIKIKLMDENDLPAVESTQDQGSSSQNGRANSWSDFFNYYYGSGN